MEHFLKIVLNTSPHIMQDTGDGIYFSQETVYGCLGTLDRGYGALYKDNTNNMLCEPRTIGVV